jgi:hypothetical protein
MTSRDLDHFRLFDVHRWSDYPETDETRAMRDQFTPELDFQLFCLIVKVQANTTKSYATAASLSKNNRP